MCRTIEEPERECGLQTPHGIYLKAETGSGGSLPLWVTLHPPIPCADKPHRSPVIVDGRKILARLPEDAWLAGTSAERLEKEHGNQWALETFGMTSSRRMDIGECKGMKNADLALSVLQTKVVWDKRVTNFVRNLSIEKVADMPRVSEHFASMVRGFQEYSMDGDANHLVKSVASIWSIAENIAPTRRIKIIPQLASILVLMGLMHDAMDIRMRYV
jgi:hypothetical protein